MLSAYLEKGKPKVTICAKGLKNRRNPCVNCRPLAPKGLEYGLCNCPLCFLPKGLKIQVRYGPVMCDFIPDPVPQRDKQGPALFTSQFRTVGEQPIEVSPFAAEGVAVSHGILFRCCWTGPTGWPIRPVPSRHVVTDSQAYPIDHRQKRFCLTAPEAVT